MVRKLVLPLVLCLTAAVVLSAADAKVRFALGVLRRDGILIPFAAYDDGDWSVPWPNSPRRIARPISLDDVPQKWWGPQEPEAPWRAWVDDHELVMGTALGELLAEAGAHLIGYRDLRALMG